MERVTPCAIAIAIQGPTATKNILSHAQQMWAVHGTENRVHCCPLKIEATVPKQYDVSPTLVLSFHHESKLFCSESCELEPDIM